VAKKKIGELLIEAGLVSETQIGAALSEQQTWGGRIGNHLVKMGAVTDEELVAILSRQLEVPRIDFRRSRIQIPALRLLARDVCERWQVVPVAYKETRGKKMLLLAMADPSNLEAIGQVEFLTGCAVNPVIAAEGNIDAVIDHCYSPAGLRDATGLSLVLDARKREAERHDENIVLLSGGEERRFVVGVEEMDVTVVRALLELLYEKGVITPEEFHRKIEVIKRRER
jgi:hypothetical protein